MRTRQRHFRLLLTSISMGLFASQVFADDQTDLLRNLAKQSKTEKRLDYVAEYLCKAAAIDAKKYGKQCEQARKNATSQLQEFEGDLATGRFELGHKDYAGSMRDLGKILYGPSLGEATQLIAQSKTLQKEAENYPAELALLQAARAAYEQGSFDAAAAAANKIGAPSLEPVAAQILSNIKAYRSTLAEAEALEQSGDLKEAQEKYKFVLIIKSNGPGNPAEGLQRIAAVMAQQKLDAAKTQPAGLQPTAKPDALSLSTSLAKAHRDERQGNWKSALEEYEAVLALDSAQPEAIQGKRRTQAKLRLPASSSNGFANKDNAGNSEDLIHAQLEDGIRAYYASEFSGANQDLSQYLNAGGEQYKGVAHFYLGACLMSQALLADPQDVQHVQSLQHEAEEHFKIASGEKYKPVERLLSPRIIAEWKSIEKRQ